MSSVDKAVILPDPAPKPRGPVVLLVDNGSLEPAATLTLRSLARRLSEASGREVLPVSMLHSSTIDPEKLEGQPAEILEPALRRLASEGMLDVRILPLFFGPSGALTDYLPERVRHVQKTWPGLRMRLAPCLADASSDGTARIATMIAERVRETAKTAGFSHPAVAVVDHGTPLLAVNAVRENVASEVKEMLGEWASTVKACSMERREGEQYDFNEPLLEKLLDQREFSNAEVIVALMFLQPGRHAGPGGDIEKICHAAQSRHSKLKIALTEPLATHPEITRLLTDRIEQGLSGSPI